MKECMIIGADAPGATMTLETAQKIVQEYGAALRLVSRANRIVTDAANLPYRKELIKQALILELILSTDAKDRELLKVGYISLVKWQEGVGELPIEWDIPKAIRDANGDSTGLAKRIGPDLDRVIKWQHAMKEEQDILVSELQKLGLW